MARYYKTAQANPLDYMYSLNVPLMQEVLKANDNMITQTLQGAGQVGSLASQLKYISSSPAEAEAAKRIIKGYEDEVNRTTSEIQRDPANWRKKLPDVRALTARLKEDFTTGEASRIQGNYEVYKKWEEDLKKQEDLYLKTGGAKGINPEKAARKKALALSKFEGTNYKNTGEYQIFQTTPILPEINLAQTISKDIDKLIKSGEVIKRSTPSGAYIYDIENGEKGLSFDRLFSKVMSNYESDPFIMPYFKEMEELGFVGGITYQEDVKDANGNVIHPKGSLIQPYEFVERPMTEAEKLAMEAEKLKIASEKDPVKRAQMEQEYEEQEKFFENRKAMEWNPESHIGGIMKDVINSSAYVDSYYKETAKPNSVWTTVAQINSREKEGALNRQLRWDIAMQNLEYKKAKDANEQKKAILKDPNLSEEMKKALINEIDGLETFLNVPAAVNTPDAIAEKGNEYLKLINHIEPLTPEQTARLAELEFEFKDVVKEHNIPLEDLMKVIEYDQKGYISGDNPSLTLNMNRRDFRSTKEAEEYYKQGTAALSPKLAYTAELKRIKGLSEKLKSYYKIQTNSIGEISKNIAKSVKAHSIFHAPVAGTKTGDATLQYIDQLFTQGFNRGYFKGGTEGVVVFDENGKIKPQNFSDVGKFLDTKESLIDNLSGVMWQMHGNNVVVTGKVSAEGNYKGKPVQIVFSGIGTESLTKFLKDQKGFQSNEAKQVLMKANPRIAKISNAVSQGLAQIMSKGQYRKIHGVKVENNGDGTYSVTLPGETEARTTVTKPVEEVDAMGRVKEVMKEIPITSPSTIEAIIDWYGL